MLLLGRNYMPEMDKNIPGPNSYPVQNVKAHLRSAPGATMGIRHSEFCSTGLPAHYNSYDDWTLLYQRETQKKHNWIFFSS